MGNTFKGEERYKKTIRGKRRESFLIESLDIEQACRITTKRTRSVPTIYSFFFPAYLKERGCTNPNLELVRKEEGEKTIALVALSRHQGLGLRTQTRASLYPAAWRKRKQAKATAMC